MDYITALLSDPAAWVALVTLITMEVVLGIDNLIFISILTNKLPAHQRTRARRIGIGGALLLRLGLLGTVAIIVQLTEPVFTAFGHGFSWRDMILIAGGLFLVWKATKEIHHTMDAEHGPDVFDAPSATLGVGAAIGQILLLDLVFSIDSIITAVGMTDHVPIMIVAVLVTVGVMLLAADPPRGSGRTCPRATSTRPWRSRRGWRCSTSCRAAPSAAGAARTAPPAEPRPALGGRPEPPTA